MVKTCTLTPTLTSNLTLHWTLMGSYHLTKIHCSFSHNCRKNSFSGYMWRVQRILTISNPCCTLLELEFCVKKFVMQHLENSFDSGVCKNTFLQKETKLWNTKHLDKSARKSIKGTRSQLNGIRYPIRNWASHSGVSSTSCLQLWPKLSCDGWNSTWSGSTVTMKEHWRTLSQ